jgi:aspartate aminotransferase-like enzyme
MLQVTEALRAMHEEGLDAVNRRHEALGQRARTRTAELGLSLMCQGFHRFAATLTAISTPPDIPPQELRDALEAQGVLVAEALGPYAPSAFRIGHMGDIRLEDVDRTFDLIAAFLADRPAAGQEATGHAAAGQTAIGEKR